MTTETMGLPTNHDNQRHQPFERKLDIKECSQTLTHHIICAMLLYYLPISKAAIGFFIY